MVDLSHLAPEGGTSLLASAEHLGASAALLDAWRRSGVAVLTLTPTVSSLLTKCCYVWGNWLARQPESVKRRYALDAADGGGGWLALGGKEVYEVCLGADLPGSLPLELREFTMEVRLVAFACPHPCIAWVRVLASLAVGAWKGCQHLERQTGASSNVA